MESREVTATQKARRPKLAWWAVCLPARCAPASPAPRAARGPPRSSPRRSPGRPRRAGPAPGMPGAAEVPPCDELRRFAPRPRGSASHRHGEHDLALAGPGWPGRCRQPRWLSTPAKRSNAWARTSDGNLGRESGKWRKWDQPGRAPHCPCLFRAGLIGCGRVPQGVHGRRAHFTGPQLQPA